MYKKISSFLVLITLILLSAPDARAISEKNYEADYESKVVPFYKNIGKSFFYKGKDGLTLHYRLFLHPAERAAIVVIPGRTEATIRYDEFAYDIYQKGYTIYLLDIRGQGISGRMLKNTRIGYVKNYNDYVDDLTIFTDTIFKPAKHNKRYAVSHSLGSNILCIYLTKNHDTFDKVVLCSPMLDINPGMNPWFVYQFSCFLTWIGLGERLVPGGTTDFDPKELYIGEYSHGIPRKKRDSKQSVAYPETLVVGPSINFLKQGFEATFHMREKAHLITTPILMLQAGKDQIIFPAGQDHVCSQAKNCKKIEFPNSFHEILQEEDSIRDTALKEILNFLQ